jgi:hypothetical protein
MTLVVVDGFDDREDARVGSWVRLGLLLQNTFMD